MSTRPYAASDAAIVAERGEEQRERPPLMAVEKREKSVKKIGIDLLRKPHGRTRVSPAAVYLNGDALQFGGHHVLGRHAGRRAALALSSTAA